MTKKEKEKTVHVLTKAEQFFIENNWEMPPEDLAVELGVDVDVIAAFHSTVKKVNETQVQKTINAQGVIHGSATIMTPGLSELTDKTRLQTTPKVSKATRKIKE
jgi:hypothetical protein